MSKVLAIRNLWSAVAGLPRVANASTKNNAQVLQAYLSTSSRNDSHQHHKLLVVGGGSGGCSLASRFAKKLGPKSIAIVEPTDMHYYQPMWTLVGGGLKTLQESGRPMESVLPSNVKRYKNKVVEFEPNLNRVKLETGETVDYDFMIVAIGIQLKYEMIKGLPEAFETPGVCSNYSHLYVEKTLQALKNFKKGNAIFTFPDSPVKCAGAPQKILYIAEDYFRRNGKRNDATLIYNTAQPVIFGVKHYADALWKVVEKRNIQVNLRHALVEVIPSKKQAVFQNLDKPDQQKVLEYEMLHVTPPMGSYDVLKKNSNLSDGSGFLNVNKETLQHVKYSNIFGIGDCTNAPTSKTAAAVAAQSGIVFKNLSDTMNNLEPKQKYDGYTSCPLVTSNKTCILAEFDYKLQPLETFPIDQAKERRTMYHLKKDIMPMLYWNLMLKGNWSGPGIFRKLMHFGRR